MAFQTIAQLEARFSDLGATRIFCKHLSENDNTKQQIYLGGNFEVLSFFPFGEITAYSELSTPNFKAPLDFFWVDIDSQEKANGAQLILYPKYPEVRLSGFLQGCKSAPSKYLQPIPIAERDQKDGRFLIFGTTADGKTLTHLAPEFSPLANEIAAKFLSVPPEGLFLELTVPIGSNQNKVLVMNALREIQLRGFHNSCRRNKHGEIIPYAATNGGGYTLEALLGITPNGDAEPDYLGWEIKSYSSSKITLMTPEPRGGFYGKQGAKAFVERFGHDSGGGSMYFTGLHKVGLVSEKTGLTMQVQGFDPLSPKKMDVSGSVVLIDSNGLEAASWSFTELLSHWNRKHAFAAYVPYTAQKVPAAYKYNNPVLMCEHTDFLRYLNALCNGSIVFDPGSKVTDANTPNSKIKARSQFRINLANLNQMYEKLIPEML
jgi:MvaI/BcnI restriction endonuclease family